MAGIFPKLIQPRWFKKEDVMAKEKTEAQKIVLRAKAKYRRMFGVRAPQREQDVSEDHYVQQLMAAIEHQKKVLIEAKK